MQIQWSLLAIAVILLLPALPLSTSGRRFLKSRRNVTASVRSMFLTWQNWADLLRAGVEVYLLKEWAIHVNPAVSGAGDRALLIEGVFLGVVLLFQVVRLAQGVQLVAPIFYLCGFTLILAGYAAGGFAVFSGWIFAMGGKRLAYQLPIMGVSLAVAGCLLDLTPPLMIDCALIFLPLVMAFMARKQLAFVAREPLIGPV